MQRISKICFFTLSMSAVLNFTTADKVANFNFKNFDEGLSITVPKTTLAVAAVQDLLYEHSLEDMEQLPNLPAIYLASESEGLPTPSILAPGIRTIEMEEGLTLNKQEVIWSKNLNDKEELESLGKDVRTFTVALNISQEEAHHYLGSDFKLPTNLGAIQKTKVKLDFIKDIENELSPGQKTRLELAEDIADYINEDWEQYNLEQKAQKLIQQQSDNSTGGGSIYVASHTDGSNTSEVINSPFEILVDRQSKRPKSDKPKNPSDSDHGATTKSISDLFAGTNKQDDKMQAARSDYNPVEDIKSLNVDVSQERDVKVRVLGYVNLVKGLAFTGGDAQISITHWVGGQPLVQGQLNMEQASYEIDITTVQGDLIAEITDQDGQLMGRGQLNLSSLPREQYKNGVVKNLNLEIHPLGGGLIASAVSGYSFEQDIDYIPNAEIAIDQQYWLSSTDYTGVYENNLILPNSNFLVRMKAQGHHMAMQLAQAGKNSNVILYSDKMLNSFFEILKEQGLDLKHLKHKGMIWGRVETKVGALPGAKVSLSDKDAIGPFYFENYIVDRSKGETDKSGMFVFLNVKPGLHIIDAKVYENQLNQIVFANENYISTSNLRFGDSIDSKLFVYDAKSNAALSVVARVAGSNYEMKNSGQMKVSYNDSDQPLFAEIFADEKYLPARVSIHRGSPNVFIPMVTRDWLDKSMQDARIEDSDKGILIGYIDQDSFDISVNHGDFDLEGNIFFFDEEGNIIERSLANPGEVKGFVIANVPEGLNSVQIYPNHGEKFINKLFVSHFHMLSIVSDSY